MEVGDQLFSSAERESFDSFLADIEDDSLGEATEPFAVYAEHQQGQGSNGSLDGDGAYGRAYASSSWGGAGASGSSRLHPETYRPPFSLGTTLAPSLGVNSAASSPQAWYPSSHSPAAPSPASGAQWHPSPLATTLHDASSPATSTSQAWTTEQDDGILRKRKVDGSSRGASNGRSKGKGRASQGPSASSGTHASTDANGSHAFSSLLNPVTTSSSRASTSASTSQPTRRTSSASTSTAAQTRRKKPSPQIASSTSRSTPHAPSAPLTAAQKKVNHILSEKKRRANIKRGYDDLCEIVPSLKEAIARAEGSDAGKSKGKGKGRAKAAGSGEGKMDGRAGPKSEGTVLIKTIDHIRHLQSQRLSLLSRLTTLRELARQSHAAEDHERLGISEGVGGDWEGDWDANVDGESDME